MSRKQLASAIATVALAVWPAVAMAQKPTTVPPQSPPSLDPPAQPLPQPRTGAGMQPPSPNPPSTDAPRLGRGGEQGTTNEKSADADFAMAAANGGLLEVELGKLAAERASKAEVKTFGQRMVDDHGKANDELAGIMRSKTLTPPATLKGKERETYERLAKLKDAAFDRAYIADMVKDHQKDVKEFEKEATAGKDPDLKAFADRTLPTLQDHLKMAQQTQTKLGGSTN
jgi:putative membrane protein